MSRRPPGRTTRRSSRSVCRSSSRCSITSRHTAKSKLSSANGSSATDPSTTSPTLRARAMSALVGESSMPVTSPRGASSTILRPLPQPASRISAPGGRSSVVDQPVEHAATAAIPPVFVLDLMRVELVCGFHREEGSGGAGDAARAGASRRQASARARGARCGESDTIVRCELARALLPRAPAWPGLG